MNISFILLHAFFWNWMLLLSWGIALLFKKHRMKIFALGVILQGFALFKAVVGMVKNPELWVTTELIISMICSVVVAIVGYFTIKKKARKK